MALSQRLDLRQSQALVMTPQLQQAIKLLQLSNIELEAFVEAEIEKNPLLQRDERDSAPDAEGGAEAPEAAQFDVASDQVTNSRAEAELDAPGEDVSAGERATGDDG